VKPVSNSNNGHSPCRTRIFVAKAPLLKERHKSATVGEIPFLSAGKTISEPDSKKIDVARRGMGPNVSFSYKK